MASHQHAVGVPMFVLFAAKLDTDISSAGMQRVVKTEKTDKWRRLNSKGLETKVEYHLMKGPRMEIQTCKILCAVVRALMHATANKCHNAIQIQFHQIAQLGRSNRSQWCNLQIIKPSRRRTWFKRIQSNTTTRQLSKICCALKFKGQDA